VGTSAVTATASVAAVGNSTHQSGASLTVSAQAGPAGYSTQLPATGLLWMHDGTTYVPRRAWQYDTTGVLKPVTFNRASAYNVGTYGEGIYGSGVYGH
jgi:hypothetical protein